MGKHASLFEKVGNSKDMNEWEPSLPEGRHRVAMTKYGAVESAKNKSVHLEGEFVVLETNNPAVSIGALHSWPWFVNAAGEFTADYAMDRAKKFIREVQLSIGSTEDIGAFGTGLAEDFASDSPETYGLILDVTVSLVTNKDGTPRLGKKGNKIYNADWEAIGQDEADIKATRERLIELKSRPLAPAKAPAPAAPPAAPAPAPAQTLAATETAAAPPVRKLGGLGSLLKKPS